MKRIGDTVAFNLPPATQETRSGSRRKAEFRSERFGVGTVTALLEDRGAYQVFALTGGNHIVLEGEVRGKAGRSTAADGRLISPATVAQGSLQGPLRVNVCSSCSCRSVMFITGPAARIWWQPATFPVMREFPAIRHRQKTISPVKLKRSTFAEPGSFPLLGWYMQSG